MFVIDAATGDDVWSGTIDTTLPADSILTGNGFIGNVRSHDDNGRHTAIAGIDLDGHTLWQHTIPRGAHTMLVPSGVVQVGPDDAGRTTLTMLG